MLGRYVFDPADVDGREGGHTFSMRAGAAARTTAAAAVPRRVTVQEKMPWPR